MEFRKKKGFFEGRVKVEKYKTSIGYGLNIIIEHKNKKYRDKFNFYELFLGKLLLMQEEEINQINDLIGELKQDFEKSDIWAEGRCLKPPWYRLDQQLNSYISYEGKIFVDDKLKYGFIYAEEKSIPKFRKIRKI